MSNLNKSTELAELKKLRGYLEQREAAQKSVQSCEERIRTLNQQSPEDVHIYQRPTDHYEKEYNKYVAVQKKKKQAVIKKFFFIIYYCC